MTMPTMPPTRRGFKSKSPIEARNRPWGVVTKHQVSGWRFLLRRISNGVALRDTRMLADPLRRQGRALAVGGVFGVVVLCGGAFLLHMWRPAGLTGNHPILAERSTNALYVMINEQLHPVLNLSSARLIVGKPEEPTVVKAGEIDKFPLGNSVGIEGAPARMVQSPVRDAKWMVCDAAGGPDAGTTVIAGADPVGGPGHASVMSEDAAILASADGGETTWLIWGGKRSEIDMNTPAVTAAVGINADTPGPRPINRQLLNLIPPTRPLVVPFVANAGDPPRFIWPAPGPVPVIGSVVVDHENNQSRYYAVTAEGLQPITPVVAAMLRASNAHGLVDPPVLTPDQVAKAPTARPIAVDGYPSTALKVIDPNTDPVACGQWAKLDGAPTSSLRLLSGQSLPVADDAQPLSLTHPGPMTASRVIMPKGSGFFVQVTGQQPESTTKEALFWLSDLGERFGLESGPNETTAPSAALGMTAGPLPVPWSVLSLFSAGPTLSKSDALVSH
ncbi:type VII secretion protein EccB [Mycobacterium sp. DBP42]|uniref:type VII secretion protein EccB n=1 Tax=Mycobacteriaceae TaxID=1762 RepID=UPI00110CF3E2|nr:type VII secretion protein EccB [Mycobacterium sp. DBP42]TMS50688.1 type VII secretion protein EccB [Mycobacterium sp. DBP42]